MKHGTIRPDPIRSGKRRPVNLSIDTGIAAHAREHGINMSQVSEEAIRSATRKEQERRWIEENREALESYNHWYETYGDPLAHLKLL